MVELKNISVVYNRGLPNETIALKDVNLTIEEGEFVVVIGPNGAGKSTLLKIILGEVSPDSGIYKLNDLIMNGKSTAKLSKLIGRVYQDPNSGVFSNLTIRENLIISSRKGLRGLTFSNFSKDTLALLENLGLGLEKRLDVLAGELSGGQKQALAMVMAIAAKPKLLLLDEHTASLDPKSALKVMDLTERINKQLGMTVVMITHNKEFAMNYGERKVKLVNGTINEDFIRRKVYSVS
ncbi:MAG: ATP-binding cassette domain-containing protein [Kosmotoga sp.]|nr:MAG: ATP-binding cassette domain-containing protein [Kosmotoga sp.]